jgi:hypothetical protein
MSCNEHNITTAGSIIARSKELVRGESRSRLSVIEWLLGLRLGILARSLHVVAVNHVFRGGPFGVYFV